MGRSSWKLRALRDGAILAGLFFLGYLFIVVAPTTGSVGFDAYAYWNVSMPDPYEAPLGTLGSFGYAPPIALVADTFSLVGWPTFLFLWMMLLIGTVVFIGGSPVGVAAAFAFPAVALELYHGNIHLLLAAAVVLGFAHPWTWSFVLLTKTTSGIGLLWFALRREWRPLGIALAATALLSVVSWFIMPSLWADWFDFIRGSTQEGMARSLVPVPLWIRLPAAAMLVAWGALTDRRWTVVVSAMIALPVLWIAGLAMLIGVIPELRRSSRPGRRAEEATRSPEPLPADLGA